MTLKHQFRLCIFCNYLYSYNKIGLHLYLRVNTPSKDWSGGIPRATMPPPYCWTSPHSAVVPITFSFGVRSRRGNDWTGRRGIHVNRGKVTCKAALGVWMIFHSSNTWQRHTARINIQKKLHLAMTMYHNSKMMPRKKLPCSDYRVLDKMYPDEIEISQWY